MKAPLKLRCNETSFNIYAALFFTFIINALFLTRAWRSFSYRQLHDYLFAASLPVVLFSAFLFIFSVVAVPWLRKPLLVLLLIASAVANSLVYRFGAVMGAGTVQHIFPSTLQLANALLNFHCVLWLTMTGLIPAIFISQLSICTHRPWWMNIAFRAVVALGSAAVILLVAALFYRDYAGFIHNDKSLLQMITPVNVVDSLEQFVPD